MFKHLHILTDWIFLISQIKEADFQINQLIEKRMMRNDPMDDKLTLYRQQVLSFFNKISSYIGSFLKRILHLEVHSLEFVETIVMP